MEILSGMNHGLKLTMNVQQYEYTEGLTSEAGYQVTAAQSARNIHPREYQGICYKQSFPELVKR